MLVLWVSSKGQDTINTFDSERYKNKYSISVENGDTIYSLIPEIWGLNSTTTQTDDTGGKTSKKASKVSAYTGSYMDLSHIPESYAIDKSKDIGEIPIIQNSANGALSYSVPIEIYQAANGMNPTIQLAYNSLAGNDVAGYGWSIGGLSSITVTNSTIYFEGKAAPAKADNTGAFTLDGQRLINLGSGNYQTELGYIKVKTYTTGTIIKYFQVYYPNGNMATFGYPTNTIAKTTYPITNITDLNGNTIDYTYIESNNVYYISEINYGGRTGTNPLANFVKIYFNYDSRDDVSPVYIAGVKLQQDHRLKEIKTYFDGNLLQTYGLSYTNANSSLLTQIDCSSNSKSLNPLKFYYGENNQLVNFTKNSLILGSYFSNASAPDLILSKGKFDQYSTNDGLISYPNFSTYGIQVIKQNWWGTIIGYQYGSTYSPSQSLLVYSDLPSGISIPCILTAEIGFQSLIAMDVDGDGKDELVKINTSNVSSTTETVTYKVYDVLTSIYSGSYASLRYSFDINFGAVVNWSDLYSPASKTTLTGDFFGTGKQTVFTMAYNKNIKGEDIASWSSLVDLDSKVKFVVYDNFSLNPSDQLFAMDYDGDGATEICRLTATNTEVYKIVLDQNTYRLNKLVSYAKIDLNNRKMLLGDVNGDGKTDIVVSPDYDKVWKVYYSTGISSGFDLQTMTCVGLEKDARSLLQDLNGDGRPDLIIEYGGLLKLYPNINGRFSPTPEAQCGQYTGYSNAFLIGGSVETGYRMSQLFQISDSNLDALTFTRNIVSEQLLTGMITSTGIVNKNQYGSILTDYNIYDKGTACAYPYRNLSGNLFLHASTESYLSGNLISANSKNYTRGIIDLRGKGFLGFEQIQTYDEIRNTSLTQVFDPTNFGTLKSFDGATASAEYSYSISVASNKIATVNLTSKTETDNLSDVTVNTSYTYDGYGNPTKEIRNFGNGLKVTTDNLYNNWTTSPYILGELYQQTVTNLRDGQTSTEKTYIQSFDTPSRKPLKILVYKNNNQISEGTNTYVNGRLTKESRKNFTATTPIETSYEYDVYGRLSRKTNPLGLYEDYGYDNFGRLATVTDHKNHSTTFAYDDWGRKVGTTSPDGITQTVSLQWIATGGSGSSGSGSSGGTSDEYNKDIRFSAPMSTGTTIAASNSITLSPGYTFSAAIGGDLKLWIDKTASVSPPTILGGSGSAEGDYIYLVTNRTTGAPATQSYIDALGREVRAGTMRFDGNYLYSDKEYDSYGRLLRVSLPFKGSSPSLWNTYTYDDYDRPLSINYASGKTDIYSYSGLSATSTIDGVTKTTTMDATGKVVNIVDPAGTITYNIRPDGQPSSIVAPENITTSFEYDVYGRQTKLIDPSAGTKVYTYDSAGNLNSETDDRGKVTNTIYDGYNRITQKEIVGELTTTYNYNTDGQLETISSNNGTGKNLTYDGFLRLSTVKDIAPDGKYLQKGFTYSSGIPMAVSYSNQNGAIATENYGYAYGTQTEIKLNNITSVWKLTTENDMGLATTALTGGLTREYGYDTYGLPTARIVKNGSNIIQDFGCNFNPSTGNLNWRRDNMRGLQENFDYDGLNRLTTFGGNTITYDTKGNITDHTAVGSFAYENTAKPYMVTAVTPYGEAIPLRDQDITYNGMQRPTTISENGYVGTFAYDQSGQRVKMQLTHNGQTQLTRYYIGGQYELDAETGTERLYLGGDAYSAASVYVKEAGTWKIYYICRDYQGSITHVVNADGSLKQELSYNPWGRLRNPLTQQVYVVGSEPALFLARGYTGHEHLSEFGLINMNARLYDSALGRFLSPDPYISSPDYSQDYNRYSYARNNPLKYTDPEGKNPFVIAGIIVGFLYLKAAHDYAPKENQGNPFKWAWNPGDWFKPSPSNPNGGIPYFEIGGGASTDGSGAHGYVSFGNPNQPMPTIGYHADYGWGGGYNQYGNTNMYYPTYNYFAPEQAGLRAEQEAINKYSYYKQSLQDFSNQSSYFDVASVGFEINQIALKPYMYYASEFSEYTNLYRNLGNASRAMGTMGTIAGGVSLVVDYNSMLNGDMSESRFGYHTASFGASIAIGYSLGNVYGAAAGGLFWSGEMIYDHMVVPVLDWYWQLEEGLRTFPQRVGFPY